MSKLSWLLLVLLLGSSLLLVRTSHEARQLFSAVDRAEREEKLLQAEYRRLDAERQTQASHEKVGLLARKRLHMQAPPLTVYVDAPVGTAAPLPPDTRGTPVFATARADTRR